MKPNLYTLSRFYIQHAPSVSLDVVHFDVLRVLAKLRDASEDVYVA